MEEIGIQDRMIEQILDPETSRPENLPSDSLHIYAFENLISFLVCISLNGPCSSGILSEYGLLQILTNMRVVDLRYEIEENSMKGKYNRDDDKKKYIYDTKPDKLDGEDQLTLIKAERHHLVMVPILRLIASVLTSMNQNQKIASQALDFISEHPKLVSSFLKDRRKEPLISSIARLERLVLLSSIFYLLSPLQELCEAKVCCCC